MCATLPASCCPHAVGSNLRKSTIANRRGARPEGLLQRMPERRKQTDIISFRHLAWMMTLVAVLVRSSAAEPKPLLDPNDLPPYPSAGSPEVLTHSQRNARQLPGGLVRFMKPESNRRERVGF
jgi:hypothetical protein